MENSMEFLKKLKIELLYDPATPLLGKYPEKMKTLIWKGTCTPMFIEALFTIAKTWKQPKCPLTDDWFKKMWCVYNGILLSHKKELGCFSKALGWVKEANLRRLYTVVFIYWTFSRRQNYSTEKWSAAGHIAEKCESGYFILITTSGVLRYLEADLRKNMTMRW